MNIGEPKHVREIDPVTLPVPETIPLPEEVPDQAPVETPAEPIDEPVGRVTAGTPRPSPSADLDVTGGLAKIGHPEAASRR